MRSFTRFFCAAVATLALFVIFSAGNRAAAQKTQPTPPPPMPVVTDVQVADDAPPVTEQVVTEPKTYSLKFDGVETAPGTPDYALDLVVGITHVGDVSGDLTGALSLSLKQNSVTPEPEGNKLSGDTWSLVIFKENVAQGVIYGDVVDGLIVWSKDTSATLTGHLLIKGGTGAFAAFTQNQGNGSFQLTRTPNGRSAPSIAGTIKLEF